MAITIGSKDVYGVGPSVDQRNLATTSSLPSARSRIAGRRNSQVVSTICGSAAILMRWYPKPSAMSPSTAHSAGHTRGCTDVKSLGALAMKLRMIAVTTTADSG